MCGPSSPSSSCSPHKLCVTPYLGSSSYDATAASVFFFPLPAGGMRRIPREEEEGVRNVVGVQVAMDVDTQRERERGRERDKRKVCWAAAVPTIIIIFNCTSTTSSRGGSCPAQKCFPAGLRA